MKDLIKILLIILILSGSFSCSENEKKVGQKFLNSFVVDSHLFDRVLIENLADDIEMPALPEPIQAEIVYYENLVVEEIDVVEIVEDNPIDSLATSNEIVTEVLDFSETSLLIDDLLARVDTFKNSEFNDCDIIESEIVNVGNFYFKVIQDIHLEDTSNIERLEGMESLLEVFSIEIDEMEAQCPDIYNNFMEYLEDMIDSNYEKLELMFNLTEE